MIRAVFTTLLAMTVLCLCLVGACTVGGLVAVATGHITPFQIAEAVQLGVDNANIWASGFGITTALSVAKAVRPHLVAYARTWLSELIRHEVNDALR